MEERIKALEERVKTLEEYKTSLNTTLRIARFVFHGITVAAVLIGFITAGLYVHARLLMVDQHDKKIEEIDNRLRTWEMRGFRPIMAFPRTGKAVQVDANSITIEYEEGEKSVTKAFKITPDTKFYAEGVDLKFADAKIKPMTPVRFMSNEAGEITSIDILPNE